MFYDERGNTMQGLKANQLQAIDMILEGKTDTFIAKELGIDKATLWRWKKQDTNFISEYRKIYNEIGNAIQEKRRKLLEQSMQILEDALKNDKVKIQVAMSIYKSFDMQRLGKYIHTEPSEVLEYNY